jgi:hypothetical protein
LEAAATGSFDGLGADALASAFDAMWSSQVRRQEAEAWASPLEHHLARADRWPFYQLKRAHTRHAVRRIAAAREVAGAGAGRRGAPAGPGAPQIERSYEGFGGRLRGRIDQVEHRHGQVVIVDYKSGALFAGGESGAPVVRAEYQRQLQLYAALYWEETGVWPAAAELVSLEEERAAVGVNPEEALALVEETLRLLARYNAIVEAGVLPPASPAAAACRNCPFKAMCGPFWEAASQDWASDKDATVAGVAARIQDYGDQGWSIELDVTAGNREPGLYQLRAITGTRFIDRSELRAGQRLRAVHARIARDDQPRMLLPSDRTELWWLPPEAASI